MKSAMGGTSVYNLPWPARKRVGVSTAQPLEALEIPRAHLPTNPVPVTSK